MRQATSCNKRPGMQAGGELSNGMPLFPDRDPDRLAEHFRAGGNHSGDGHARAARRTPLREITRIFPGAVLDLVTARSQDARRELVTVPLTCTVRLRNRDGSALMRPIFTGAHAVSSASAGRRRYFAVMGVLMCESSGRFRGYPFARRNRTPRAPG